MTERVIEPLEMSDTEIVELIRHECWGLAYKNCAWEVDFGCPNYPVKVYATAFRDAMSQAAADWREFNQ